MTRRMRARDWWCRLALSLAVYLLVTGCTATTRSSETVPLITEEEAALPPAPEEHERGACGPPEIRIDSPKYGATYRASVPVDVRFKPSDNSQIDLASIRIELLKLGVKIDLTERAREYIKATGIDYPQAKIPSGNHRVRISVGDTSGKSCSEVVEFTVAQ